MTKLSGRIRHLMVITPAVIMMGVGLAGAPVIAQPSKKAPSTWSTQDKQPRPPVLLTMGECWRLGGNIEPDSSCPYTVAQSPHGGSARGHFTCRVNGNAVCIDESS